MTSGNPASKETNVEQISLDLIDPNPFASRVVTSDLKELSNSLLKLGQLAPIRVRPSPFKKGCFQIVFGHRRTLAARSLEWKTIAAQVAKVTDEEMVVVALTENLERNDYSDYEQSLLVKRLHEDFKKTEDEIASMIGKSKSYVSQHITMTSLFDGSSIDKTKASELLQHLTERQARILARLKDPLERFQLAKVCIDEMLCLKEMERLIGHPRDTSISHDGTRYKHREHVAKSEDQIMEIIQKYLAGLGHRDIRPVMAHRMQKLFSLFDDFPPADLFDYASAADHHATIIRQTQYLDMAYDSMKIYVFGDFALATFFVIYRILSDGRRLALKSRVTMNFVMKNNDWFIIHEHWSPFDNQGLFDLAHLEGSKAAISSFRSY